MKGADDASLTDHVTVRVDAATLARLDALAPAIVPRGVKVARSIALRACIVAGLDVLEKQHGVTP